MRSDGAEEAQAGREPYLGLGERRCWTDSIRPASERLLSRGQARGGRAGAGVSPEELGEHEELSCHPGDKSGTLEGGRWRPVSVQPNHPELCGEATVLGQLPVEASTAEARLKPQAWAPECLGPGLEAGRPAGLAPRGRQREERGPSRPRSTDQRLKSRVQFAGLRNGGQGQRQGQGRSRWSGEGQEAGQVTREWRGTGGGRWCWGGGRDWGLSRGGIQRRGRRVLRVNCTDPCSVLAAIPSVTTARVFKVVLGFETGAEDFI